MTCQLLDALAISINLYFRQTIQLPQQIHHGVFDCKAKNFIHETNYRKHFFI